MGPLIRVLLAALLVCSAPAPASAGRWDRHVAEASARFGIPVAWIQRVIQAESAGRTTLGGRPIVSRAGAMGLMQLMPGTWAEMRARHGLGADPHEPRDNILAGAAYLRLMYDRFGYPGLFAAYNAGPARYARHLAEGVRLPAETVSYVASVTEGVVTRQRQNRRATRPPDRVPAAPSLFAVRIEDRVEDLASYPLGPVEPGTRGELFVPLLRGTRTP